MKIFRVTLLSLYLCTPNLYAVDAGYAIPFTEKWNQVQSRHSPQFYFNWENDAFLVGTISDRFYTNGLRGNYERYSDDLFWKDSLGYLSPLECHDSDGVIKINECKNYQPTTAKRVLNNTYKVNTGYFLAQTMFTPSDIRWTPDEKHKFERPYAGWLQLGFSTSQSNIYGYESFEWSVGCVGSCAMADIAQAEIHRNLGDQMPQAWETQIKSSPTVQVKFERSLSLVRLPFKKGDFLRTYLTMEAGNIMNRLGVGARFELPIGYGGTRIYMEQNENNLCDKPIELKPQQPDQSVTLSTSLQDYQVNQIMIGKQIDENNKHEFVECDEYIFTATNTITAHEVRFYLELTGQFVGYNGLLQGPLNVDSSTQDFTTGHKPFVGAAMAGFKVQLNRVAVDMSYHMRSTESDGEALAFGEHSWMRLTIATPDTTGFIGIPVSVGLLWGISRAGL